MSKWYVSQIGRREHYALPAYLHRCGQLGLFATDIWAPWAASPRSLFRPDKLAQRFEASMSAAPVASRSFLANLIERVRPGDSYQRWTSEGRSFGAFASGAFGRAGLKAGDVVIGYTAANLEQLVMAKQKDAKALHVQIDPGLAWYETRRQEQDAHPDAEDPFLLPASAFVERIRSEWQEADKIVVHSAHSRDALVAQGVASERCAIIPPAFNSPEASSPRRLKRERPLRVLFVGSHCLAKGYHVFSEAARQAGPGFEFVSVGRQMLKPAYLAEAARHVAILGAQSQARVREEMARADVLVFPTLSDGFGLVQLEAMAAGLPVIATSACGEVVQDGINGRIVPLRDVSAIVTALWELREDPTKYEQFSQAASERVRDFSPAKHFAALMAL
jgi:glycosyltransferase involved in cell wall biosynthesis